MIPTYKLVLNYVAANNKKWIKVNLYNNKLLATNNIISDP